MFKKVFIYCIFILSNCESNAMEDRGRLEFLMKVHRLSQDVEKFIKSIYAAHGLEDKIATIQFCLADAETRMLPESAIASNINPEENLKVAAIGRLNNKQSIAISPYLQKLIRMNMQNQKDNGKIDSGRQTTIIFHLLHVLGKQNCHHFPSNEQGENALNEEAHEFALRYMKSEHLDILKHEMQNPENLSPYWSRLFALANQEIERRKTVISLFFDEF